MTPWLLQAAGGLLLLFILFDIFYTVLYARIGTGFVSHYVAMAVWRIFVVLSRLLSRRRAFFLSLAGPTILVATMVVWIALLDIAAALVIYPGLGKSILSTTGETPTDFWTALYIAGDAMTTVGAADLHPKSPFYRLFYFICSVIGLSIVTLILTYIIEVYNALLQRNALALKLHLAADETGDAAELIVGLAPHGDMTFGSAPLSEWSAEITMVKESHHFHSVLLYFRFQEAFYSIPRIAMQTLDLVSLVKSAMSDQKFAALKESTNINLLWRASMQWLTTLAKAFHAMPEPIEPDEPTRQQWRQRYLAAVGRLQKAGIETMNDPERGAEIYISLRARWDRYIRTFAEFGAFSLEEVDRTQRNIEESHQRPDADARLHSAG